MYYVMRPRTTPLKVPAALDVCPEVDGVESWLSGQAVTVPVPQPLRFDIDRGEPRVLPEDPAEAAEIPPEPEEPGELLEMYQLEMLLLTGRVVTALREAGVDNLQVFDAVIRDPVTGREWTNYKVVNIVGVIACANLEESAFAPLRGRPMIDMDFIRLAIDEERAGGQLFFRLGECVTIILVHEKVKNHLVQKGINTLSFVSADGFTG
jgi:hypothetical protein